jgi:hypothetical protein
MSSDQFIERPITPLSNFSCEFASSTDSESSDIMEKGHVWNMTNAIRNVHDTAAEQAAEAKRVISDYDMVTNVCRACQPASRSDDFLTALRTVCLESNSPSRFIELCNVGLMFAFVAVIEHLCAIETVQVDVKRSSRKLKLTALCLKTMCDANTSFCRYTKNARLTNSLAHLLCCVSLPFTVSSLICEIITKCIKTRDPDIVYELVQHKCLQGLLIHFKGTHPYLKLMSELLHQGTSCHFVLHDSLRANHVIGTLIFTVDTSTSVELRHLAGKCLNLLLDFDLVRTSMYMRDLAPSFSDTMLHHITVPGMMKTAMVIIQASLNVQRYEFDDLVKNTKRYSEINRTATAMEWIALYKGDRLLRGVTSALHDNRSCELHSSGPAIIEQLCQVVVYTPEQCHHALNVMIESIHVMVCNNNTHGAKNALSAIIYLLHNGRISVHDVNLQAAVRHMAMLFGIKFDVHCRDKQFIVVRTLPHSDSCSICSNEFNCVDRIAVRTHCSHEFCKQCLDKWSNSNRFIVTCPTCRSSGIDIVEQILGQTLNNSSLFAKRHLRFT